MTLSASGYPILSFFIFTSANAGMSDKDKSKAWDCIGIYMANYFLPSGEKFASSANPIKLFLFLLV